MCMGVYKKGAVFPFYRNLQQSIHESDVQAHLRGPTSQYFWHWGSSFQHILGIKKIPNPQNHRKRRDIITDHPDTRIRQDLQVM